MPTGRLTACRSAPDATVVDVESAAADVATSVRLLAEGYPARARDVVESALEVARQPFLPGVHALWVEQRRELLEDLRLRALEVVADAALESGEWPAAKAAAEQAVALAPLRESVYPPVRGVGVEAVHRALLPWRGTHVVDGCGVAWLGQADVFLARLAVTVDRAGRTSREPHDDDFVTGPGLACRPQPDRAGEADGRRSESWALACRSA